MKKIYIIPVFIYLAQIVHAQTLFGTYSDSVRLEFPEHRAIVVCESSKITGDSLIEKLPALINDITTYVQSAYLNTKTPLIIEVLKNNGRESITIRPSVEQITRITVKQGEIVELLPPGWEVFVRIENHNRVGNHKIYIYTQDFESIQDLSKENYSIIAQALHDELKKQRRQRSLVARMIIRNRSIEHKEIILKKADNFLVLGGNAGIGLISSQLYPELGISLGTYLGGHKNHVNKRIEFTNNYMFAGQRNAQITSFLSVSYSKNFSKKDGRPKWNGIGVGGMLADGADFFNGATIKIFVLTDLGSSKLNLIPELYLSEGSYGQFGMKLAYTF